MKQNSQVIRDISRLGLNPKTEKLAYQIASKVDLPVVFLINSEWKENFARRHSPQMPNEFWINIAHQSDPKEFERLVVGLLYRGIQDRRRYSVLQPLEKYDAILDFDHKKQYYIFLNRLTSVATSLDAEFFLRQYGIYTSDRVHHAMLDDRINKLREYRDIRSINPYFSWWREIEVQNLVDYGNYYRRGKAFRDKLMPILRQVNKHYVRIVQQVASLILDAEKRYTPETADETVDWLLRKLIKLFKLENMVTLGPVNTYKEHIQLKAGNFAVAYSLIPDDWDHQEILITSSRHANYFLTLVQQSSNFEAPVAHIYLINEKMCNAYSNPGAENEYILSFTTGLFHKIHSHVYDESFNPPSYEVAKMKYDRATYLNKFFCYVIFYITAHEYAHVLNGDCSRPALNSSHCISDEERQQIESRADHTAKELINRCFLFQYRPQCSSIRPPHAALSNSTEFRSWLKTLSTNDFYQFTHPLVEFQLQDQIDTLILNDSIRFARTYIRDVGD